MDSSVLPKDEIWFLRVCHHVSTGLLYTWLRLYHAVHKKHTHMWFRLALSQTVAPVGKSYSFWPHWSFVPRMSLDVGGLPWAWKDVKDWAFLVSIAADAKTSSPACIRGYGSANVVYISWTIFLPPEVTLESVMQWSIKRHANIFVFLKKVSRRRGGGEYG